MSPRFAVMFKTHFWDAFTERQLNRLIQVNRSGDVFVVIDDLPVAVSKIDYPRVFRVMEQGAADLGLPRASTDKSIFWYNIDYSHYLFYLANPGYDYYVAVEYDVCVQLDLDMLVGALTDDRIDYLGCPIKEPSRWAWSGYHDCVYGPDEIRLALSCFSIYSQRAISMLFQRRLAMADEFRSGKLSFWPNNEAFIPTEIRRANYKSALLQSFGSINFYDWWPPMHESELENHPDQAFIHPVLEGDRYVRSVLRHERRLFSFFDPHSPLRRRLAYQGPESFRWEFCRELGARSLRYIQRKLEDAGLRRHWTANASSKTVPLAAKPP
jgi:hypothetical protein